MDDEGDFMKSYENKQEALAKALVEISKGMVLHHAARHSFLELVRMNMLFTAAQTLERNGGDKELITACFTIMNFPTPRWRGEPPPPLPTDHT